MFGRGLFQEFHELPDFNAIFFVDPLGIETINKVGRWWRTPRVSWDGISNIKIEGNALHGEANSLSADRWVPFTVDLRTGEMRGQSRAQRSRVTGAAN